MLMNLLVINRNKLYILLVLLFLGCEIKMDKTIYYPTAGYSSGQESEFINLDATHFRFKEITNRIASFKKD